MKPNNADKDAKKMKQNAQTQEPDGIQAVVCVIYNKVRDFVSTVVRFISGGGGFELQAPHVTAEATATRLTAL